MTISTISPAQLSELCAKDSKLELLDVRTSMEFEEVHLSIARNVPLSELDPQSILQTRQKDGNSTPLYIICRSGSRGKQACEKFIHAGFSNVVNVEGGTLACVDAGLSVVRGKKGISLERQVRIAAGLLVLSGVVLSVFVHPNFVWLSGGVGAGLIFAGITDTCGMGLFLARMPWNQCSDKSCCGK